MESAERPTLVDVVVVSYNSRQQLRACVEPLAELPDVEVVVVDNASSDKSLEALASLAVDTVARRDNGGFAVGCNTGWRRGSAPYVLFLNPDARVEEQSLRELVRTLEDELSAGAVGPLILDEEGEISRSQRRFPTLSMTFAYALFLHRVRPGWRVVDDIVRDPSSYRQRNSPDWISGACMLVRRSLLAQLEGFDERFFLYAEDVDLCRRIRDAGYDILFEPNAVARHAGGASAPKAATLPLLARSQALYVRKHFSRPVAVVYRFGYALGYLSHLMVARGGLGRRSGYARALRQVAIG